MCGGCGTGRAAAPWEDVLAGAGPAQRAARARAAGRLLAGRRWRVAPWRGGYLLTAATGAARPVASLGELWDAVGAPPGPPAGEQRWARAGVPAGFDLQAATVWIAAHTRALTAAELPAGVVAFHDGTAHARHRAEVAEVGLRGPDPGTALSDLLRFAGRD